MSSQRKVTEEHMTSTERLTSEMGDRLRKSAGQALKAWLESGEVKRVNGKYVGDALTVARPKKNRITPTFAVVK